MNYIKISLSLSLSCLLPVCVSLSLKMLSIVSFTWQEMEKVFIRHVYAVGMHHHGPAELAVGVGYCLLYEPNNPYDRHAVAVVDRSNKNRALAYLRRSDVLHISEIFRQKLICSEVLLKPKESPTVWNRRTRPQQKCAVGFKTINS